MYKQPLQFSWDECQIIDNELEYRKSEDFTADYPELKTMTDEQVRENINDDYSFWENQREFLYEDLGELMHNIKGFSGFWKANGVNMGWRQRSGYKYFTADNGKELLNAILPDADCTVRGKVYTHYIKLVVSHHDAPMGETYIVKPVCAVTYERNN